MAHGAGTLRPHAECKVGHAEGEAMRPFMDTAAATKGTVDNACVRAT